MPLLWCPSMYVLATKDHLDRLLLETKAPLSYVSQALKASASCFNLELSVSTIG